MMRKLMVIILLGLALLAFTAMLATAQEAEKEAKKEATKEGKGTAHEFVGADKCKLGPCHPTVHESWLATKHAKAFDLLSDEEKAKPECAGACHITGKLADGTVLEGVQCEACHGPGKDYKSPKIMSKSKWKGDPEAYKKLAIEAGLIYPTAETCTGCHKEEGNPNFKPFDFEKSKGTVHPASE
ncbi:MAG: hypothetical protein JSW34_06905 [Candidatus Zixiibacteriota bacterium]|nr:MAG: hypothetical protein JSW34_06905 [candidate division Zixibacteria bacterium]